MPNKHVKKAHDETEETSARKPQGQGSLTLAKGGMSPVADRKHPKEWEDPAEAGPATDPAQAITKGEPKATPAEPVGGWVDGSTGRGKILVPEHSKAAKSVSGPVEDREALRQGKGKANGETALPAAGTMDARVRAQKGKEEKNAAAESGARERQEEDRNQQDAVQDEADDMEDEEADENF